MSEPINLPGLLGEAQRQPNASPSAGGIEVSLYDGPEAPGGQPVVILHLSAPAEMVLMHGMGAARTGAQVMALAHRAEPAVAKLVLDLAMMLVDDVYEARGDLKPAGGALKHELIERHRRTLTKRLELILKSRREQRKVSHFDLAKTMVEEMLNEVFGKGRAS